MSDPFIGEIRMFGGNFAPVGWMLCQGQSLFISDNDALFNLIGTTYGGDGQSTFNLPNLASRIPVHAGQGPDISQIYTLGEQNGVESVTLNVGQLPNHSHTLIGSSAIATNPTPTGNIVATSSILQPYVGAGPDELMAAGAIGPVGGSQPHDNMVPFLCVNYIISLFGIFPNQN